MARLLKEESIHLLIFASTSLGGIWRYESNKPAKGCDFESSTGDEERIAYESASKSAKYIFNIGLRSSNIFAPRNALRCFGEGWYSLAALAWGFGSDFGKELLS